MTSLADEGARLARDLACDPTARIAWEALARWCARTGARPDGADPEVLLPHLLPLLGRDPEDRSLMPALLGLLEARFPDPIPEPAVHWQKGHRLRRTEDHHYDVVFALPLELERARDGARMRLVPGGAPKPGHEYASCQAFPLPSRHVFSPLCYLDVRPISKAAFTRLVTGPDRQLPAGPEDGPALVSWRAAQAYADTLGFRVPREAEWARPMTQAEIGRTRPGGIKHAYMDSDERRELKQAWSAEWGRVGSVLSAFGIEYDRDEGAPAEWTSTRVGDYVDLHPEESRPAVPASQRHTPLVRGVSTLEPATGDAARHAFRLVVSVGSRDT